MIISDLLNQSFIIKPTRPNNLGLRTQNPFHTFHTRKVQETNVSGNSADFMCSNIDCDSTDNSWNQKNNIWKIQRFNLHLERYLKPIPLPPTRTVKETLKRSQKVAEECGDQYVLVTYDWCIPHRNVFFLGLWESSLKGLVVHLFSQSKILLQQGPWQNSWNGKCITGVEEELTFWCLGHFMDYISKDSLWDMDWTRVINHYWINGQRAKKMMGFLKTSCDTVIKFGWWTWEDCSILDDILRPDGQIYAFPPFS